MYIFYQIELYETHTHYSLKEVFCTEFYPNPTKGVKNRAFNLGPYVKHCFHCDIFHENHHCSSE
jgi:hypothetical protein